MPIDSNLYLFFEGAHVNSAESLHQILKGGTQDNDTLTRNIHDCGLQIHEETVMNGNCFFHAICLQLKRLRIRKVTAGQLRCEVVDSIFNLEKIQVSNVFLNIHFGVHNVIAIKWIIRSQKFVLF